MQNAEEYIRLKEELKAYILVLDQAAELIKNERISNYPIMVVHKQEVEIGIPLEIKNAIPGSWLINASTLEEFVGKSIVDNDKVDEFRDLYKSHDNHVCLFILSELGAQFIFYEKKLL